MRENLPYLLILVAVSFVVMLGLRVAQNRLLRSISRALLGGDEAMFRKQLGGTAAKLLLRPATREMLRLEAAIYTDDAAGVFRTTDSLRTMRLRPEERLSCLQKALGYAVLHGEPQQARTLLADMEELLGGEKDERLMAILTDAYHLVGVYVDKNTALLPELQELAQTQEGNQRGLTQYRVAKLHHFNGNDGAAEDALHQALESLTQEVWRAAARAALQNPALLDTH